MDRFSKVSNKLYRGGKPSSLDLYLLKEIGIKKIVSLDDKSGEDIKDICDDLGFEHIIWGIGDGNDPKIAALKSKIIPTLTIGGPTYIHCKHGKDRTGMSVAMFRILNGWKLKDALIEAFRFGMGKDLPKKTKQSYYDAVIKFDQELKSDNNKASDIVSLTRETNSFGPTSPGNNDMQKPNQMISGYPQGTDIEFSHLSRIASSFRIFCKCKSSDILKPNVFWNSSRDIALKNPYNKDGELYSAEISKLDSNIEYFNKPITNNLINNILVKDIDVAILRDNNYLILNPSILINIKEEDVDINDLAEVGLRDNSTNSSFSYPGSGSGVGGMPDGAAGAVVLPFSGSNQF